MTYHEIMARIAELDRNKGAFYAIVSNTTPKMRETSRATGCKRTFSVTIRKHFTCKLGVVYSNCVNNSLERQGKDPTFEAQKPFGKHYITGADGKHNPYILQADKDEGKYYLAVDMMNAVEKEYYIDGRKATKEEIADLVENYFYTPSKPKEGVTWRTYSVESILEIN